LDVLQQQDYLDIWVDTRIEGGADWFQEIKEAIDAASMAVLLISADFLNSKFITEKKSRCYCSQSRKKDCGFYQLSSNHAIGPASPGWHSPWLTPKMADHYQLAMKTRRTAFTEFSIENCELSTQER
jgi:hypothetical protein